MLDLQTGKVIRSAISSEALKLLPSSTSGNSELNPPPRQVLEFQTALPPIPFEIPVQETPPPPLEFQDAANGVV